MRVAANTAVLSFAALAVSGVAAEHLPNAASTAGRVLLPRDTPVVLMATREIRSDAVVAGTVFPLRVDRPVRIGTLIVVPVGTPAFGEVVAAKGSRTLGRNGALAVRLSYIQLGDARIALSGDLAARGRSVSPALTVRVAGPVGLFHPGNNARVKAGDLLTGVVAEDVTLDLATDPIRRIMPTP